MFDLKKKHSITTAIHEKLQSFFFPLVHHHVLLSLFLFLLLLLLLRHVQGLQALTTQRFKFENDPREKHFARSSSLSFAFPLSVVVMMVKISDQDDDDAADEAVLDLLFMES